MPYLTHRERVLDAANACSRPSGIGGSEIAVRFCEEEKTVRTEQRSGVCIPIVWPLLRYAEVSALIVIVVALMLTMMTMVICVAHALRKSLKVYRGREGERDRYSAH